MTIAETIGPPLEGIETKPTSAATAPPNSRFSKGAPMHARNRTSRLPSHSSPQEALQAPPEEFLYVACLHRGTGVEAPDFLAVVDAEDETDRARDADAERRRRAPPLRLEPLQLGLPRARPLAPDRSRLPLLADPRAERGRRPRQPRIEKVIEPEELVRETGYTRPHTVHCMPGDNVVLEHAGRRRRRRDGGFAVLDARTFDLKGRWEDGGAARRSTTTSGTSRARTP